MQDIGELPAAAVQVESIGLHALEFSRTEAVSNAEELQLNVGIATQRPTRDRLAVEMTVAYEHRSLFRARISYRAIFHRTVPFEDEDDEVSFWKIVVTNIATIVLFPYIRMALATVVSQAGLPPFSLPLVNPAVLFAPDEIRIAEFHSSTVEATGEIELED